MENKDCKYEKGKVVEMWETGDSECDAYSERYECGGVYNRNYMDVIGSRDHDCFWECVGCKYKALEGADAKSRADDVVFVDGVAGSGKGYSAYEKISSAADEEK